MPKWPWQSERSAEVMSVIQAVDTEANYSYAEERTLQCGKVGDVTVTLVQDETDTYVVLKNGKNDKQIKMAYFGEFEVLQSMLLHGVLTLGLRPNVTLMARPKDFLGP